MAINTCLSCPVEGPCPLSLNVLAHETQFSCYRVFTYHMFVSTDSHKSSSMIHMMEGAVPSLKLRNLRERERENKGGFMSMDKTNKRCPYWRLKAKARTDTSVPLKSNTFTVGGEGLLKINV